MARSVLAQMCFRERLYDKVNAGIYVFQRRRVYMARSMLTCVLEEGVYGIEDSAYGKSNVGIDGFQRRVCIASSMLAQMCVEFVYGIVHACIYVYQRIIYLVNMHSRRCMMSGNCITLHKLGCYIINSEQCLILYCSAIIYKLYFPHNVAILYPIPLVEFKPI